MLLAVSQPADAFRRPRRRPSPRREAIPSQTLVRHDVPRVHVLGTPVKTKGNLAASLEAHVTFLADSSCAGRGMGTPGATNAAFYISRHFKDCGLAVSVNKFVVEGRTGRNIIGIRRNPGASKYVVVMSSNDGLGVLGGNIYPCADANGSGVAALLELAADRRKHAGKPKNFVYAATDGHHMGMAGAQELVRYLERIGIRTRDIVMVVNLDTMGANLVPPDDSKQDYIIALGGLRYRGSMEYGNIGLGLSITYDYYGSQGFTDMFYRRVSEQKAFLDKGVPCVMFTAGITDNTFKKTDTAETLNYPVFARRVELISRWMLRL